MRFTFLDVLKRRVRTDDWNWEKLGRSTLTEIKECIESGSKREALELVDYLLPEGKRLHDAFCDHIYGMLTYVAEKYGEEEVYNIQRATADLVVGGWIKSAQSFSPYEFVALLAESMRSHRSGPGERGDIRILEEEERIIMSFDPCGSGGRIRRVGEIDGTPPRTEPPFNLGVTKKQYPWSWGKVGVPYYCTHCCIMTEIIAIERLGYPLIVTEYPDDPYTECKRIIYKKKELIPAVCFTRVGKKKQEL